MSNADPSIVRQLVKKVTELAKMRVSDNVLKESLIEEINKKFNTFLKRSMEGIKE